MRLAGNWTPDQLRAEVARGGRVVVFEYVASFGVKSLRGTSVPYVIGPDSYAWPIGLAYALFSAVFGWWAVPWGVLDTVRALVINCGGGRDVTDAALAP